MKKKICMDVDCKHRRSVAHRARLEAIDAAQKAAYRIQQLETSVFYHKSSDVGKLQAELAEAQRTIYMKCFWINNANSVCSMLNNRATQAEARAAHFESLLDGLTEAGLFNANDKYV